MKKLVFFVLCLLIAVNSYADFENFFSFGFSFQNITNLSGDSLQHAGGNIGLVGFGFNDFMFWNNGNVESTWQWSSKSQIAINPFICIGLNMYNFSLGKP